MRTSPFCNVLMALLCAAAVSVAACHRGAPGAQSAQPAQGGQGAQTGQAGQSNGAGQVAGAGQAGQGAGGGQAVGAGQSAAPGGQPGGAGQANGDAPGGQPGAAGQANGANGVGLAPDASPAQQDAAAAAANGQRPPTVAGQQADLGAGRQRLAGDRYGSTGAAGDSVVVPSGTHLTVELESTLSSSGSREGESFRARVVDPVMERGLVVIPSGSEVAGVVTRATGAGRIGGRARLGIRFTELLLPSGASVPLRASWAAAGRSKTGRDAAIIGGAAAGGAIIGHNVGRGHRDKGTVIGALVGAVVGTAVAANAPGRPVVIPSGATLRLRLRGAIEVPVPR
jgi:hypothetical protein